MVKVSGLLATLELPGKIPGIVRAVSVVPSVPLRGRHPAEKVLGCLGLVVRPPQLEVFTRPHMAGNLHLVFLEDRRPIGVIVKQGLRFWKGDIAIQV